MRRQKQDQLDELELKYHVEWYRTSKELTGWVGNVKTMTFLDDEEKESTALLIYVLSQSGQWFKCMIDKLPYFYVDCEQEAIKDLQAFFEINFEKWVVKVDLIDRVDLDQINHLAGKKKKYLKLQFRVINDLVYIRNRLRARIEKNSKKPENQALVKKNSTTKDPLDYLIDIREYDVPYHCRVCIDTGLRCGKWFTFKMKDKFVDSFSERTDLLGLPDLRYISFDIETTKLPLKFPDSKSDRIIMISMTHSEKSILITNREVLPEDVASFDYAPKPDFATTVTIFNEVDEKALLMRFFAVIFDYKPLIISSFNGDRFDWPFIEERCIRNGFYLEQELGIRRSEEMQEYYARFLIHMDCFAWVERDAYLPQGSHGLKAVTRAKLGYEPVELDPEEMMKMALENPQKFAEYSISDSVATYWLYRKHIHDFILALCTIIPLQPDEVLRKGSGTLCECLLMAMAFGREIVFPNKQKEAWEKFYQGHLIDSETYIGGKVECLRSGIYRSDLAVDFRIDKECMMSMHNGVERLLRFVGYVEQKEFSEDEIIRVATQIREKLDGVLAKVGKQEILREKPLIYHLDVAAMYPNIILTNRLQPVSIVDSKTCSGCVFNEAENKCKREMDWQWKVDFFPLQRNEYEFLKINLEYEVTTKSQKDMEIKAAQMRIENLQNNNPQGNRQYMNQQAIKSLSDLPQDQQQKLIKQRVRAYCQKNYKAVHRHPPPIIKKDVVCMRENDFYVQAVRDFRDRRYEFKELVKVMKGKMEELKKNGQDPKPAKDLMALYDSLQLAHKIILNSFYGYVMRKGARWYSMPMAGIVTHVGSQIISTARQWVDRIGLPLELDTDGIWCLLPLGFPEEFTINDVWGKAVKFSYPCFILNELVHEQYKNNQYQRLKDPKTLEYEIKSEMSIFFEVDGPYRCMTIPAAREENKQLKKRYVVFNKNGSIAEIKGFEIKRRGELKILKQLQQELFSEFLKGSNLQECYQACAKVAQKFLDILKSGGQGLPNAELLDYIGESRVLSKDINEYDSQKGVAITAGKRMAEYLGADQMKGGGINCNYIITKKPHDTPVNERSIPILIFESSIEIRRKYLKIWLRESKLSDDDMSLQNLVDWDYYIDRLSKTIQKLLVIPAASQRVPNPIPDVRPPDWLCKKLREENSGMTQTSLSKYFVRQNKIQHQFNQLRHMEIEELGIGNIKPLKQDQPQEAQTNKYNMEKDFRNFLKEQQRIWTFQFKNKERTFNKENIKSHFQSSLQINKKSTWHILQLLELSPGQMQIWYIYDNGTLMKDVITMNRTFYVNSYKKEAGFQLVKKQLPRDRRVHYLYSITMAESKFQMEFNGFTHYLANPDIEGIYEQNIPLIIKFISEIGNMCMLTQEAQASKNTQYSLEDLKPGFSLVNKEYLQVYNFQHCFLLWHEQIQENNGLWAMISNEDMLVVVVNKAINALKNQEYIRSLSNQIEAKRKNAKLPDKKRILVYALKSDQDAIHLVQSHFESKCKSNNYKLCVVSSSFSATYLTSKGLEFLYKEVPTLFMPPLNQEKQKLIYQWDFQLLKQAIEYYTELPMRIRQCILNARYVGVPFCNLTCPILGVDDLLMTQSRQLSYMTDILYQRALKQLFNCISWYSADMGRDNRDLIAPDCTHSHLNNPGIYMDYCVEFTLLHFSINTIANSDELKNVDREASALIGQNGKLEQLEQLDELSGAKTAFKVLKLLVQGWLDDIQNHEDEVSDMLISNIESWVFSGESPLFEPYLGNMLKRLNFKIFNLLTMKLTQLGAKIIYSSQHSMMISTSKQSLEQAQNYTKYIIDTISVESLFKHINFKNFRYYTSLIYKDQNNYLGYLVDDQVEEELVCQLHLTDYLPFQYTNMLQNFLIEVLLKANRFKKQKMQDAQLLPTNEQIQLMANLHDHTIEFIVRYIDEILQNKVYELVEKLNENYRNEKKDYERFQSEEEQRTQIEEPQHNTKMRRVIEDDEDIYSQPVAQDEEEEDDSFVVPDNYQEGEEEQQRAEEIEDEQNMPVNRKFERNWMLQRNTLGLADPDYENQNMGLKTINYLMAILGVNEEVELVLKRIKANSCRLLKVSEHSKEAVFKEPCLEVVLQNMTCNRCYQVMDLDIFRERWECKMCFLEYEKLATERKLCAYLEQQLICYQIQDLYCRKCKQVQDYTIQEACRCAGQFQLRTDLFKAAFINNQEQLLRKLLELAQQKEMPCLAALINTIIL